MLTFKEYLIEIFNKPYPVEYKGSREYGDNSVEDTYHIHAPNQKQFRAYITHDRKTGLSSVSFDDDEGLINMTGKMRYQAHNVIGAVARAVKHHVDKTPTSTKISFEGFKTYSGETGRNRLYRLITSKYGGETKDVGYMTYHSIPSDNIRKAA